MVNLLPLLSPEDRAFRLRVGNSLSTVESRDVCFKRPVAVSFSAGEFGPFDSSVRTNFDEAQFV